MKTTKTLGVILPAIAFAAVMEVGRSALACTALMVPGDYESIQAAVDAASYCDRVEVSAGTYDEAIVMKAGVDVIGSGSAFTTISSLGTVVTAADDATIRGFTIADGSIGVYVNDVSGFSILDNVVTNISNPDPWGGAKGIHITNSNDVWTCNNQLSNVSDEFWGIAAGIYANHNSSLTIYGNRISDIRDLAWDSSYGIFDGDSTNSVIVGNLVYDVEDREWDYAVGIQEVGNSADVSYNTVVYISEQAWDNAYGIYNSGSDSTVSNNIVAYILETDWDTAYGIFNGSDTSDVSYNDVWSVSEAGAWPGPGVDYYGPMGEGNLLVDPLFVDPDGRDFHLLEVSPLLTASESGAEIGAYGAPCLCDCAVELEIDVKPFHPHNRIILTSRLPIPVAILGSDAIDVTQVDVTTLAFGPAGAAPFFDLTNPLVYWLSLRDVNRDGERDLVALFKVQETGLALGDSEACLTGEIDGQPFVGCDSVEVSRSLGGRSATWPR